MPNMHKTALRSKDGDTVKCGGCGEVFPVVRFEVDGVPCWDSPEWGKHADEWQQVYLNFLADQNKDE